MLLALCDSVRATGLAGSYQQSPALQVPESAARRKEPPSPLRPGGEPLDQRHVYGIYHCAIALARQTSHGRPVRFGEFGIRSDPRHRKATVARANDSLAGPRESLPRRFRISPAESRRRSRRCPPLRRPRAGSPNGPSPRRAPHRRLRQIPGACRRAGACSEAALLSKRSTSRLDRTPPHGLSQARRFLLGADKRAPTKVSA
jgi:hypothetical protein